MRQKYRYIFLLPLSFVYRIITGIRNWFYDKGVITSHSYSFPTISIGNLTVGGTGKTPFTEYIIELLSKDYNLAVLSRGYKRKTEGFYLARENSDFRQIGDEPFQIKNKYKDIMVAVDEDRVHGIEEMKRINKEIDVIILDDAFQHRRIKPGLSILLTDYSRLYVHDHILPGGNLRECKSGSKRADIIIVTKCPERLSPLELRLLEKDFKVLPHQKLFFSAFEYKTIVPLFPEFITEKVRLFKNRKDEMQILLMAGIANPKPLITHIDQFAEKVEKMIFPDHYEFSKSDFKIAEFKFNKLDGANKIILVTEKDAARIVSHPHFPESLKSSIYAIPVRMKILKNERENFIHKITEYVTEDTRNS